MTRRSRAFSPAGGGRCAAFRDQARGAHHRQHDGENDYGGQHLSALRLLAGRWLAFAGLEGGEFLPEDQGRPGSVDHDRDRGLPADVRQHVRDLKALLP